MSSKLRFKAYILGHPSLFDLKDFLIPVGCCSWAWWVKLHKCQMLSWSWWENICSVCSECLSDKHACWFWFPAALYELQIKSLIAFIYYFSGCFLNRQQLNDGNMFQSGPDMTILISSLKMKCVYNIPAHFLLFYW